MHVEDPIHRIIDYNIWLQIITQSKLFIYFYKIIFNNILSNIYGKYNQKLFEALVDSVA